MNLRTLVDILWAGKQVLVAGVAVFLALGLLYLYLVTPVYQATAVVLPTAPAKITSLNHNLEEMPEFGTGSLFGRFGQVVSSNTALKDYFREANVDESLRKQMVRSLKLTKPSRKEQFYEVSVEAADREAVAGLLNEFLRFCVARAKQDVVAEVLASRDANKAQLEAQIKVSRDIAARIKQDRVEELQYAIEIARDAGYREPLDHEPLGLGKRFEYQNNLVDAGRLRLHARGVKELEAELKALKAADLQGHSPELRELEGLLGQFNSISLAAGDFEIVYIDKWAEPPLGPVKPNTIAVIFASLVLGTVISLVLVFALNALKEG